jgi:multiple sugar transport system substrate-binding protein
MKVKKTFIILLVLIFIIILAACGSGQNNESTPKNQENSNNAKNTEKPTVQKDNKSSNDEKEEIIKLRFAFWAGGDRTILYNRILDNFEKKYPHIKISREIADFGPYWDKLATETAAGNPPDIFQQHLTKVVEYASRDQLLPLTDYVDQGLIDLSDFNEKIINSGRYEDDIVMVTLGNSITGALYNADIFAEAGVDPPEWDWTWTEFEEKAIELANAIDREDFWGVEDHGGDERIFGEFVRQRGGDFYNAEGKLGFTKEDMITYLSMFDRLRQEKAAPSPEVSEEFATDNKERHIFPLGMVAISMKASNHLGAYQGYTEDELSITRVPNQGGDEGGLTSSGAYISISPHSEHPKEAAMLINYWINDPEAGELFLLEQGVPGSSAIVERIKPLMGPSQQKIATYVNEASEYAAEPYPAPASSSEVVTLFEQANDYVAFGQKSIEKAVEDFFNEASRILQ